MVVVTVREKYGTVDRSTIPLTLGQELLTKADNPCSSIDDDQVWSGMDLQTGRIAAKF
jgi:hypothetical protein